MSTIKQQIADLSAELKAASQLRRRTAFLPFLAGVYDLYIKWRRRKLALPQSKKLANTFDIELRSDSHPVRIIIEACSKRARVHVDPKILSRFTACVRNAHSQRTKWTDFQKFVGNNGGIAGVAALKTGRSRYKRTSI